jgi:hypothetical protein
VPVGFRTDEQGELGPGVGQQRLADDGSRAGVLEEKIVEGVVEPGRRVDAEVGGARGSARVPSLGQAEGRTCPWLVVSARGRG